MTEFDIQGPTRVCAVTGRSLAPGDRFCAALRELDGKLVRTDYAAEAWSGPPPGTIAHWTGRVPRDDRPRKLVIHDELLVDCLNQLEGATEPNKVQFRYVVGLLLMRRKRMKFDDLHRSPNGPEILILRDVKTGQRTSLVDPRLSEEEIVRVQKDVFSVLGWSDAP